MGTHCIWVMENKKPKDDIEFVNAANAYNL
jgi:hypothetical protein